MTNSLYTLSESSVLKRNTMPVLEFRGSVTGIGSLPHVDPDVAVTFVAQHCPDVPFWPQLPRRAPEEYMLMQMLTPMLDLLRQQSPACIHIRSGQLAALRSRLRQGEAIFTNETAAGFFAFERVCAAGSFANAQFLKGQVSGPLTLARCLWTEESASNQVMPRTIAHSLLDDPGAMDELTDYLCRLTTWQIERLQRFDKPVMIFVDEPVLTRALSIPVPLVYLRRLLETIRSAGAVAGIHCCALGAAEAVFSVAPDVISFDAHSELESFMTMPEMHAFLEEGGGLALGMIPTLTDPTGLAPEDLFMRWSESLTLSGLDVARAAKQSLITATCGLGLLSLQSAQASFVQARRLAFLVYLQAELASVQE
jgi:hypothetical protein